MDPVTAGIFGAKFIGGAIQAIKGNRILKKTKLPNYEIAGEFNKNIGLAKEIKNMGGMPKQQYQAAMNNIMRSASFGLGQLQKRNSAIAGVGSILQRTNDATIGVDVQDANMALQNKRMGTQMEMGANTALAGQKMQKQQWEKFNPYLRRINEGQGLLGSGLQNMFGAATGAAQTNMYAKMYGSKPTQGNDNGGGGGGYFAPIDTVG